MAFCAASSCEDRTSETMGVNLGEHAEDWWGVGRNAHFPSPIGWRGTNPRSDILHLSDIVWKNPEPDKAISHIDFISTKQKAAPFLVRTPPQ